MSTTGLPGADYETDREQIGAIIANRAPELSTASTAFGGEQAGALAQITQSLGGDIDQAGRDYPPSSGSSSQALDNSAEAFGIANGKGGFGRRGATFAQGFTAYLTGYANTPYDAGQQAIGPGGVTLVLRNAVTIPASPATGQVLGTWDADTTSTASQGAAGNLTPLTQLTLVAPPSNSDSTIELLTGPEIPGQNQEKDAPLLLRIQFKMQRPPNGGNGTDFATWAETATDANGNQLTTIEVFAFVFPNYYGDGLPLVLVLQAGSGTGRQCSTLLQAAIAAFINGQAAREGRRPVGSTTTVSSGFMPASRQLVCVVRTVPNKASFAFDWARGLTVYTVNSTTTTGLPGWATAAGANVVLELQTLAPVSLKDAITAGSAPRIQVDTNNGAGTILGPIIPEQWPCLAFLDAAGRTSLALKVPSVPSFAANVFVGNAVYSGGPIVDPVGASILDTINRIGPSRASGLADPAQPWQDVVGVTTLSTAAENTLSSDGVTRLVARCVAGGVLIGIGGSATPSIQDVQASDNTINGPEILFPGRILTVD